MTDAVKDNEEVGPEEEVAEGATTDETPQSESDPTGGDASADSEAEQEASDGEAEQAPAPPPPGEPEDEISVLRAEYATLNDRHLRLAAEFNNFRRRSEQERLSAWSRAQADLVEKFLDVLDDLHRVAELDLTNATVDAIMEGIDLVEKKFVRVLADADAEIIDPTDQPFDPESMEAMMRVPAETDEQADTVAQVFQKGYSLKGILVRPARVSVYTQG